MDFDEERIYYSHQNLQQQKDGDLEDAGRDDLGHLDVDGEDNRVDSKTIRRHFKEFLRECLSSFLFVPIFSRQKFR